MPVKELVINLDPQKVATWYQKFAGIRANTYDAKTVETVIRDFIEAQCGPDVDNPIQDIKLDGHRDVNMEIRYWTLRITGERPEFMKVCRGISENFAL